MAIYSQVLSYMTVLKLLSFYSSTIQWICYISVYSISYVHFQFGKVLKSGHSKNWKVITKFMES